MAVFQGEFFAKSFQRRVSVSAVLPCDAENPPERLRTVYLLHGYTGVYSDWLYDFTLPPLSQRLGIVFIMPSGENNFYLNDTVRGAMYEDFICKELPEFCQKAFNLPKGPENTAVGGLSMGGYGAVHCGLAAPETFGAVIALSAALITDNVSKMKPGDDRPVNANYSYYRHVFGDPAGLVGGHADPKAQAKALAGRPDAPRLYMACGTEDFLIGDCRSFHRALDEMGYAHTNVEAPGGHELPFWQEYLTKGLEWLVND